MFGALRKVLIIAAAALFGAGHAACACLSVAGAGGHDHQQAQLVHEGGHEGGQHGHHAPAPHERAHDDGAPGGPGHSACSHCDTRVLAKSFKSDDAALAQAHADKYAFTESANEAPPRFVLDDIKRMRLRWAAPPDISPVSLKIRLLN